MKESVNIESDQTLLKLPSMAVECGVDVLLHSLVHLRLLKVENDLVHPGAGESPDILHPGPRPALYFWFPAQLLILDSNYLTLSFTGFYYLFLF